MTTRFNWGRPSDVAQGFAASCVTALLLSIAITASGINAFDAGGGRSGNGSVTVDASIGGISTLGASTNVSKGGYIGQLYDVVSLAVTSSPALVQAGGSSQLGGVARLDDDSLLPLLGVDVSWAAPVDPIASINAQGLAIVVSSPATGTATFGGSYLGVASASASFIVNRPPTVGDYVTYALQNAPHSIPVEKLLASASDPDDDALTVSAVSATSTNGGTVTLVDGLVTYSPATDFVGADRFSFTVSDGLGGTATADVGIQVLPSSSVSASLLPLETTTQGYLVQFAGVPGFAYRVQRAPTTSGPWVTLASVTVGTLGLGQYEDPSPPADGAFYRTAYP